MSPVETYQSMVSAMGKVQHATFGLKMQERIYGTFVYSQYEVKLNQKPYQVYLKCIKPDVGAEVLYREGLNDGKALVSPHRFPYMTISLDPEGSLIRKQIGRAHV